MDHCAVVSCFHFGAAEAAAVAASSLKAWRLPRLSGRTNTRTASGRMKFVSSRCCMMQDHSDESDAAFPHLTPKPVPRSRYEIIDRRNRIAFLEGAESAPQEELPDPNNENFRSEMRNRLLYSEPVPVYDDNSRAKTEEDIEFDVFEHLVLTIRYILHLRYRIGERLQLEDELILREEAIPYHPERDLKVGCGIDHIKVDIHPDFGSRCFFIVRVDQSEIDFSYRKCMIGLASTRGIPEERAIDLIYFFRTTGGQRLPLVKSL